MDVQDRWETEKPDVSSGGVTLGYHSSITGVLTSAVIPALWTVSGGQFDWGGRLRKSNGGAQRFPQNGWKSFAECKGRRELDCETDISSRDESRA
jgi:hypothetical protein